nr:unnamed protein product [Callosobruchus analis]
MPQGEQEWLNIAKQFNDVWNFPNCVGSVDGKHVVLQAPINTGSEFFNYKSTFSIVLMAVVDADYCFTFADVGCQGRISDGGVIKNTSFYKKLQGNELHLPSDNALPNTEKVLPYVFVADDAFPLEEHIMKPYPGSHQEDSIERIFNYRLSRARRVVENAFGILSVVFRVLRKPMLLEPHKAAKVVLACIYLHNYLRRSKSSRNIYTRQDTFDQEIDGKIIQGSWRQEREANPTSLLPIRNIPRKSAGVSKDNRKQFAEYFKTLPQGEQEWLNIAKQFNDVWNFPNCVGSVDGKHVVLQAPINTGSEFFNYKSTFSIVLMAVVDADYCFTFADVGCQGRISDGGVIKNTSFYKKLQGNELHLPSDNALPNTEKVLPYVFVADDAFPLEEHIMKPYPGSHQEDSIERIFNYRLSRARRVVENAFGILSVVFRVLRKPMLLEPHKAAKVVLACIYLHNYLRRSKSSRNIYTRQDTFDQEIDGKIIQGSWRQEREANPTSLLPIRNIPRKSAGVSKDNRKQFAEYFKTVGRVPWQELYL